MPDPWQIGDLARQDLYPDERYMQPPPAIPASTGEGYAGLGGDPSHLASTIKNWWINQPSWLQRAQAENQKTSEAFQRGGMGEIAKQLATDTTEPQELYGAFGVGNIKGVRPPLALGTLAATSEYRPPFYSAVEQAVQGAKQNAAPGQQWAGFLRNQPGVKPEEVEALKLGKLFEQPGSVPKEAVLGEIAANRVNVKDVIKSDALDMRQYSGKLEAGAQEHFSTNYDNLSENQQAVVRKLALGDQGYSPTKFSQYTLPGGENYREMLLTLPSKARAPTSADIKISKDRDPLSGTPMWRANVGDHFVGRYGSQEHAALEANRWISEKPDNFKEGTFRSSHFDEPNVLAHVRYNDRVIDGKKTLFVEEVQSDWHQKGKREGYQTERPQFIVMNRKSNHTSGAFNTEAEAEAFRQTLPETTRGHTGIFIQSKTTGGVPDAPFKTTWPELAMKRIIREAAEKGYDKVAWTPGSVQAERYDLSKHVDGIQVSGRTDARTGDKSHGALVRMRNGQDLSVGYGKDGIIDNTGASNTDWKGKHLSDVFGKDIAQKMVEGKSVFDADLKIGGEGMKGFYDEILPATVNKLVKKHGGRVTQSEMRSHQYSGYKEYQAGDGPTGAPAVFGIDENGTSRLIRQDFPSFNDAWNEARTLNEGGASRTVHTLDITPQLRAQAMKGFPLFSAGGVAATGAIGELARQDEYR